MTRPLIVDTFMMNDELDMLECRLDTMAPAVDYFVAVEADVDHQNHPKPYHLTDNLDRFTQWADKLIVVQATDLPTLDDDTMLPDDLRAWSREWAQRDWVWEGLKQIPDLADSTIVLHGDIDEICAPLFIRNARPGPKGFVLFGQTLHCFAVDWLHPEPWGGTVAITIESVRMLGHRSIVGDLLVHPGAWQVVRNQRNGLQPAFLSEHGRGWHAKPLGEAGAAAGWHFSWLGGTEATQRKLGSFCHPEVADRIAVGIESDSYLTEGFHVDGRKMTAVDVDETWPDYIRSGHAPTSWFRSR